MDNDTDLGGPAAAFPATRFSVVRAAGSADPAVRKLAQDIPDHRLLEAWSTSTSGSSGACPTRTPRTSPRPSSPCAMERSFFDRFDPEKARFRTFIRVRVDGFVANEDRAAGPRQARRRDRIPLARLRRRGSGTGPARRRLPAPIRTTSSARSGCASYSRWRSKTSAGSARMPTRPSTSPSSSATISMAPTCRSASTYARLARSLDSRLTQVTNYLAFARRQFRQAAP